jgi:hypothetical protein
MLSAPAKENQVSYRMAAVDVHKRMLAVVVTDIDVEGEYQFEERKFGAKPGELHVLAQWLVRLEVEEVVMESTAQYWKPVWGALERYWKPARQQREGATKMSGTMHLCQVQVQQGATGAKERFRRRRTDDQAVGGTGVGFKLCAGSGTAALADRDETKAPIDSAQSALSESTGESVGTSAHQVIERRVGSAGGQCAAYAEGAGGRGNRPKCAGSDGGS